jgi:hypothetical protein
MDAAALLKGKRSEVLKALANHLHERDDDTGLALLQELLEISNMQFALVADLTAVVLKEVHHGGINERTKSGVQRP